MTVVQRPSRNLKQRESEASVRYTVLTLVIDMFSLHIIVMITMIIDDHHHECE